MKKLLILTPLLLLSLSCTTWPFSTTTSTTSTTTSTSTPSIVAFTASPTSITAGQTATLIWNVTNATSVQIDQGVGSGLAVAGTVSVTPSSTVTYMLTASNSAGSVTSSVTVSVTSSSSSTTPPPVTTPAPALRPNIVVFDISPNIINAPPGTGAHSAVMRWEVHNAATVTINGSPVASAGSQTLTWSLGLGTHTYTLRAFNPAGEDVKTQAIRVNP
ncbi:MAG: hypothetical protein PHO26_00440 [Dehalococcoidia bacterium]|nr:hypothetical protein [Dehalococcoidia bacterium]MDD5493866.1 hypothetical protein [Dehalococcoidia bacterium]